MIVSIGEVVWDIFPDRQVLGGAPVNVAYHLNSLGVPVSVVSRVGDDDLGRQTIARLTANGLQVDGVQVDPVNPTGCVNVTFGEDGEPAYDIVAPAAWDFIEQDDAFDQLEDEFSLVFGTLGQRHERSRAVIGSLLKKSAFSFYDVNLRPPFTTRDLVCDSLPAADIVKLNGDELRIISAWLQIRQQDKQQQAAAIMRQFDLTAVIVTEGADGAWVLAADGYFQDTAELVTVVDTVGAGDAFFAAIIDGFLRKMPWQDCLRSANQRGAYVASQNGATPPMP